jgi:hypothetical protein
MVIARFVADIAPMGISDVWQAVQEISRAHYMIGLADPTIGGPVTAAINEIAKIDPPRSWPKEDQIRFRTLPYDMQLIVSKREADRDRQIRHMQNERKKERDHETDSATSTAKNAA